MVKKPNPNKRNKVEQRSIGNEKLKAVGTAKERGRARNKKRALEEKIKNLKNELKTLNDTTNTLPGTETYTLLFWEEVPEFTKLVLIPNSFLSDELRQLLKSAHGGYVNTTVFKKQQNDAIINIYNALQSNLKNFIVDSGEIPNSVPAIENKIIIAVYRCGLCSLTKRRLHAKSPLSGS